MQTNNTFHNKYWDYSRHWHSGSEAYASGEQLQDALFSGWNLDKVVFRTEHKMRHSARHIVFFVVVLWKNGERCNMPVLANPYVERLLNQHNVHVINVERRHQYAEKQTAEAPMELHYIQEVANIG